MLGELTKERTDSTGWGEFNQLIQKEGVLKIISSSVIYVEKCQLIVLSIIGLMSDLVSLTLKMLVAAM